MVKHCIGGDQLLQFLRLCQTDASGHSMTCAPLIFGMVPVSRSAYSTMPNASGIRMTHAFFFAAPTRHLTTRMMIAARESANCQALTT